MKNKTSKWNLLEKTLKHVNCISEHLDSSRIQGFTDQHRSNLDGNCELHDQLEQRLNIFKIFSNIGQDQGSPRIENLGPIYTGIEFCRWYRLESLYLVKIPVFIGELPFIIHILRIFHAVGPYIFNIRRPYIWADCIFQAEDRIFSAQGSYIFSREDRIFSAWTVFYGWPYKIKGRFISN